MVQKTLFSAMESVIIMMKEVELKEKTAELAKMEAAEGGADILDRVEELGQMVKLAKEANEMVLLLLLLVLFLAYIDLKTCMFFDKKYGVLVFCLQQAGEIYGEKAVLCTELKELQSHVLSLSDERNESVATLHEVISVVVLSSSIYHLFFFFFNVVIEFQWGTAHLIRKQRTSFLI